MAAVHYPLFLGTAIFVLNELTPQPAGAIILYALLIVQASRGALICWRRTGLPFMTASMVNAAVMSVCLIVLVATGHPTEEMGLEAWVLLGGFIATIGFFAHI